jgi:hypothetical protein
MSEKESTPKQEERKQMTPEEMEIYKTNLLKFYKSQMEMLEPQLKYEETLTTIEELRTRRMFARMKYAEMMTPNQEEQEDPKEDVKMPNVPTDQLEKPEESPKPRNLKKAEA